MRFCTKAEGAKDILVKDLSRGKRKRIFVLEGFDRKILNKIVSLHNPDLTDFLNNIFKYFDFKIYLIYFNFVFFK